MKQLGDAYVKSEFRLHKTASPEQTASFLQEWKVYLDQLSMTARARESVQVGSLEDTSSTSSFGSTATESPNSDNNVFGFGSELPSDVQLSDEQKLQLEKLRDEADTM